eukprot:scaffold8769_cov110-Skeletonema_dohrnii-CCMP3373.AAC.4
MSSQKRPAGNSFGSLLAKSAKEAKRTAEDRPSSSANNSGNAANTNNPFLSRPTQPEEAIKLFLIQSRSMARRKGGTAAGPTNFEIEARLGTILSPYGQHDMRALSSGPKLVPIKGMNRVVHAFVCNVSGDSAATGGAATTNFEGGITRSNYLKWTNSGLSEVSPLSLAFSCRGPSANRNESESAALRSQLNEVETVETVFAYPDKTRVAFPHHSSTSSASMNNGQQNHLGRGHKERKEKVSTIDIALPAAPYDLRLTLATETPMKDDSVTTIQQLANGWNKKRIKRRRSYSRTDKSFAWRIDVTEVTSTDNIAGASQQNQRQSESVGYEIEMELSTQMTQKLMQTTDDGAARKLAETLSQQLWYMLQQLNPTHDVLEVDEFLSEHPSQEDTKLAIGQCGSLRRFMESGCQSWRTAIGTDGSNTGECKPPRNFIGSMPVNFSRHNIEEVQRSDGDDGSENTNGKRGGGGSSAGYYLSEKTDGVRYLLVFTGKTAVLVDRASHETKKAFQPKLRGNKVNSEEDPLHDIVSLVKPGAVLDGEVVVHRKLRRPIFIVFDVLANSSAEPILHLPFEQRLRHLKAASFVKSGSSVDLFDPAAVSNPNIALPLVRKNFVKRVDLDQLLSYVVEGRGMRIYRYGETHHHLTDGIIFQPNAPYICGTDVNLLKWKYLDTVTIDVEILPQVPSYGRNQNYDSNVMRVGVMGDEGTVVDMTRYVRLPATERHRLEADRAESGSKIAEVGFDPETGEWYYRTMRPDKVAPNHISTVLGTLLELAENLSTEELRYRMSVPSGKTDSYTKEVRSMQKQLLEHQRRRNKAAAQGGK